jgi:uncharacterized protein GlcG (DUF336 family)
MSTFSLERADELVKAAIAKAVALYARPVCVAICDGSGFLLAFVRMDGAPLRSIAIAQAKAYTAVRMGVTTEAFLERLERENLDASYFCDATLTPLPGGSVLRDAQGAILGGAGISGLTSAEDQVIANHLAELVSSDKR